MNQQKRRPFFSGKCFWKFVVAANFAMQFCGDICHFLVALLHAEAHGVDVCSLSSSVENSWYDPFKPLSIPENRPLDHSQEMVISESLKWDDL